MKTFKKLFSVAAIVALLGTLVPMYAFGANYNEEMQSAYAYAHAKGITTMTSIDNADMFGGLTRIAMAKMIANYAINVLGLEPDTSKACTFTDVSAALDKQYDNGVTLACQLGLMGQNITAFRPNDPVIRAEFGTTLSRALNANDADKLAEMNAADPYYKEHLNYLKNAGIMTNISNPSMTEVRGYVMLMMMRADDNYSEASEGCSVSEILACFGEDDSAACLAACGEAGEEEENTDPEEVKAGTLNVTMKSEEGGEIPSKVSSLPIATYTLKASDEDVNVTSLVIEEGGYGEPNTLEAALFIDGQRVSKVKRLKALDTKYTLNFTSSYALKAGKSVDVELRVYDLTGTAQQFNIKLVDVNSSAEKVKLPSNVKSNTFKLLANNTAELTVSAPAGLENPKAGAKDAELFEIKLAGNSNQDVELSSLTLVANDKEIGEDLDNVALLLDNDVLAEGRLDGKYLTFTLDKAYTIEKGKSATLTVRADVLGGAGKTFNYSLDHKMDLFATAVAYEAPVEVKYLAGFTGAFASFTVSAGRVTIDRTNPSLDTFTKNKQNVYLGSITINDNNGSNLTMTGFDIEFNADISGYVESVKVRYGSASAGLVDGSCTYTGTKTTCSFDDEKAINGKLTVYAYADIANVSVTGASFVATAKNFAIKENENDKPVTDLSLPNSWSLMKGTASALNVTRVNLADKVFAKGAEDIDAVSFKIKTNDVDGIKIKRIIFSTAAGVNTNTVRNAKLYVGEKEYDATVSAGSVKVADTITLDPDTTTTFTLKVSLTSNPTVTAGFTYTLTEIQAEDTSDDRNDLSDDTYSVAGRKISVADNGTLTVTMENTEYNKNDKSILAGTEATIAEYQLKTTYEDVKASKIELTFSDSAIAERVSDVELTYGDKVLSNAFISGAKATFDNADLTVTTTKTPLTVKLITKAINEDNGTGIIYGAKLNEIAFTGLVGKDTGNPVPFKTGAASKLFDVVPAIVTASIADGSTNAQTKLNLSVAMGDNELDEGIKVTLSGLTYNEVGGNGSLTGITVTDPDENPLAGSTYELVEGDNIYTITYVVDPMANNISYTVNLTDVEYVTTVDPTLGLSNRMKALTLVSR